MRYESSNKELNSLYKDMYEELEATIEKKLVALFDKIEMLQEEAYENGYEKGYKDGYKDGKAQGGTA